MSSRSFEPLKTIHRTFPIPWKDKNRLWLIETIPTEKSVIGKRKVEVKYSEGLGSSFRFLGFNVIQLVQEFDESTQKTIQGLIEKEKIQKTDILFVLFEKSQTSIKDAVMERLHDFPDILFPFMLSMENEISLTDIRKGQIPLTKYQQKIKNLAEEIKAAEIKEEELWYVFFTLETQFLARRIQEKIELVKDILKILNINYFVTHPRYPVPPYSLLIHIKSKVKSVKKYILQKLLDNIEQYIPRPLTEEEIRKILEALPIIRNFDKESQKLATTSMHDTIRATLELQKITPLGMEALKREMLRQYEKSVVEAGTVVGVNAAESMGRPVSQTTLNSFHFSGTSKNLGSGLENIERIIYLSSKSNLKYSSLTIHFKNRTLTFDDVLRKREELVSVQMKDLLAKEPEYDSFETFPRFYWHDMYSFLWEKEEIKEKVKVLRLTFDVSKLLMYRVSLQTLVDLIEQQRAPSCKDQCVICIASPMFQGIIDVFAIEDVVEKQAVKKEKRLRDLTDKSILVTLFLTKILQPTIQNIQVKGIAGITALFPVPAPILKIVDEDRPYYSKEELDKTMDADVKKEQSRLWYLILNSYRMTESGISWINLLNLLTVLKIPIAKVSYSKEQKPDATVIRILRSAEVPFSESESGKNYVIVKMPESITTTNGGARKYIQTKIEEDEVEEEKEEEAAKQKNIRAFRRMPTPLKKAAYYYFAETNGTNLKELFTRRDIDKKRTLSNNFFEVLDVLGIEACRHVMITELSGVISATGVKIDPRHIVLLVDFMVNRGMPRPISYSGLSGQDKETLEMASFERSLEVIAKTAVIGKEEKANSISSAIFLGQMGKIGSAATDVRLDKEKEQNLLKELGLGEKLDVNVIRETLEEEVDEKELLHETFTSLAKKHAGVTEYYRPAPLESISRSLESFRETKEESKKVASVATAQVVPEALKTVAKKTQTKLTLKGLAPTALKPLKPLTPSLVKPRIEGKEGKEEK